MSEAKTAVERLRSMQAKRAQPGIELVEHDAWFDGHGRGGRVDRQHAVEVFTGIDDDRGTHGLAALRGAGAALQHRHAGVLGDLDGAHDVGGIFGHDHADRLDLIDRGIGAVAAAAPAIEQHLALDLSGKLARQTGFRE